ncbi:MAG: DUF6361 family protein [Phycisphaeraceae bacterium]
MSSFTWLDYSERERQQVMEVIELFREEDTRDELGIGSIRDTLADLLFPGTSTVQTRLRYFLFVPWVMQEMERRRVASHDAGRQSRRLQGRLCDALKAESAGAGAEGIIGALAGAHVQRLPSNVYWNGLGVWGVRLYPGSEAAYYQSLDGFHGRQRMAEADADVDVQTTNWDPALPAPPEGWLNATALELTEAEADYLVDRVRRRAGQTLLHELIERGVYVDDAVRFAWDHPATQGLPGALAEQLTHAHNFSQLMHGAALLYNLMLAEQIDRDDWVTQYRDRLAMWWDEMVARDAAFAAWRGESFWELITEAGGRVALPTRAFVEAWREHFEAAPTVEALLGVAAVRELVAQRERRLKGKRARIGDPRMLEKWNGASGTAPLDYRWTRPVAGYLNDLHMALEEGGADA